MTDETRLYNSVAPLRNVAALTALIDRVQNRAIGLPGMACFYGWSGFGKSTAAIYAANKFQAVLVQCKSSWTKKNLCKAVLAELGLPAKGNTADLVDQISAQLAVHGMPLIIDEADHLIARKMVEIVRDIYEGSQAPVILIGEELLPQKLKEWERVHGRMLDWVAAEPADLADLNHLAPIYAPGIAITADLRVELLRMSHGSTRRVCVNLAKLGEQAQVLGVDEMSRANFDPREFFTGTAPKPRRSEIVGAA
ncbi:ATP-binding protein [Pararhodobacter sp.]|uniref:ATP-binding protein n=1 Tax=Pararhodobacter sp. TaxID=2127056 RepID=UPI002AFF6FF2|nr:ATP-binding protein [Pararhodobacter sp.]